MHPKLNLFLNQNVQQVLECKCSLLNLDHNLKNLGGIIQVILDQSEKYFFNEFQIFMEVEKKGKYFFNMAIFKIWNENKKNLSGFIGYYEILSGCLQCKSLTSNNNSPLTFERGFAIVVHLIWCILGCEICSLDTYTKKI